MKIHEKYIAREVLAAILLVLAALIALYGFFDLIESLKDVGKGEFAAQHAFLYVSLRLPGRLYELMPIAALIGTLYALSGLARHSEITVLRTSGMTTRHLLWQLFKVAGLIAVAALLLGETIVPPAERMAQDLRARAIHRVVAKEFGSGLWVKDGHAFINIRAATPEAELEQVRVYQFDARNRLQYVLEARQGIYQAADQWQLKDVVRTVLEEPENNAPKQPRARVETETSMAWTSALTPEIIAMLMVPPERMSLIGLVTYLQHLSSNHQKTERYEIALWKKFFYPLAALVMVALALPFGYTHNRMGGVSLQLFGGVMVGVLFHMLNGLFSSLGVIHAWPPFASAIAPSALFLATALGMLWWVERR
ncbi:MAG: LPS export ABC transporter permease LptG [Zoogloeaceae bacterium]|jgi:lipopolysaccharide export system permease protein|nr:LPS export ABC transporter permease LptG [Zoogloeaceae bacterium]